jgi:hypothetical protein
MAAYRPDIGLGIQLFMHGSSSRCIRYRGLVVVDMGKGMDSVRQVCAAIAISLLGTSAAFGRSDPPANPEPTYRELSSLGSTAHNSTDRDQFGRKSHGVMSVVVAEKSWDGTRVPSGQKFANNASAVQAPGIAKLSDPTFRKLSAIDGSTLALTPISGGLARKIVVADGRIKKTRFALFSDRMGVVSEGEHGGGGDVVGIFRVTDSGIAALYSDGRSEILTLNGSGGVSMVMKAPTGDVNCVAWYPAGYRSSVAERKAALAAYARRLGIDYPRNDISVKQGCTLGTDDIEEGQRSSSSAVYNPLATYRDRPARGSDFLGSIVARAPTFSERKEVAKYSLPYSEAMNPASSPDDGFENFYANFLAAHEGGYTDNDGNGSPANFGINQGANPDIDVWNLTQDEAKQILHDRYWVPAGADRLPTALAAVHGDTAINMGVDVANELLAESGGDPQKYIDLRDARYRGIAAQSPDKAKYLPIWLGRNEDLRNFSGDSVLADWEKASTGPSISREAAELR